MSKKSSDCNVDWAYLAGLEVNNLAHPMIEKPGLRLATDAEGRWWRVGSINVSDFLLHVRGGKTRLTMIDSDDAYDGVEKDELTLKFVKSMDERRRKRMSNGSRGGVDGQAKKRQREACSKGSASFAHVCAFYDPFPKVFKRSFRDQVNSIHLTDRRRSLERPNKVNLSPILRCPWCPPLLLHPFPLLSQHLQCRLSSTLRLGVLHISSLDEAQPEE